MLRAQLIVNFTELIRADFDLPQSWRAPKGKEAYLEIKRLR
jgi:hypothetical protein